MTKIEKTKNGFFHYKICGLDYIYLANGFEIKTTPYGDAVTIHQMNSLHLVIGEYIVKYAPHIRGQELRFFRAEIDFSQFKMSKLFGTSLRTYQKWESDTNKPVNPQADRLMRIIYLEFIGNTDSFSKISENLDNLAAKDLKRMELQETSDGWKIAV